MYQSSQVPCRTNPGSLTSDPDSRPWPDRRRPPSHPLSAADNRPAQTYLNLRSIDNVQVLGALQRLASVFFGPRPAHSSKPASRNSCLDEKFIGNICVSLRNVSSFFPSKPVQVFGQFSLFVIQVVFRRRPFFLLLFSATQFLCGYEYNDSVEWTGRCLSALVSTDADVANTWSKSLSKGIWERKKFALVQKKFSNAKASPE